MGIDPTEAEAADGRAPGLGGSSGRPGLGLGETRNGLSSRPRWGPDRSKLAVGGNRRFLRARSTLSKPAAPAAVSVWPTFDLTEPIAHWCWLQPIPSQSDLRLSTSTASPTGVPVGVALDQIDVAGLQPACS